MDMKLFDPVASPHGILGVHTTRSLRHLSLFGMLTTSYGNDLLVARQGGIVVSRPIAHRVTTELSVAVGLFNRFAFSLVKVMIFQSTEIQIVGLIWVKMFKTR